MKIFNYSRDSIKKGLKFEVVNKLTPEKPINQTFHYLHKQLTTEKRFHLIQIDVNDFSKAIKIEIRTRNRR